MEARWLYLLLAAAVIAGLWLGRREPIVLRLLLLLALVFPALKKADRWRQRLAAAHHDAAFVTSDAALISGLVADEETSLVLSGKMRALSQGLLRLRLPGPEPDLQALFAPSVRVSDLGPAPEWVPSEGMLESHAWPLNAAPQQLTHIDLWRPLLDNVSSFEHARLYIISGEHPGKNMLRYEARSGFDALAQMKSGEWRALRGTMDIIWQRAAEGEGKVGAWQITGWKTEELQWNGSLKRLFVEVLDRSMRTAAEVAALRRSQHYEATLKYYRDGMKSPPHPYFSSISANQKEGLAVVDIDGDGFDDLYITVRIGKNMLLHNNGDGTFTEEAARYGLDLPGHTTCALFADFDNDGDLDAILGRSLLKTTYLENKGGCFYQPPIPAHFPMAVVSMAAADYNKDGLLDVYLCTYRAAAPPSASPAGGVAQVEEGAFDWPDEFFTPEMAKEFRRRLAENRKLKGGTVLDQVGPPNVLLVNRGGGRFEVAPENKTVGIWRNSLQATWGDYDQDGDPDLFIANDWGPSNLFRNDGAAGFKDVTEEAGTIAYGFSMGRRGATTTTMVSKTCTSPTCSVKQVDEWPREFPNSAGCSSNPPEVTGFTGRRAGGDSSRSPVSPRRGWPCSTRAGPGVVVSPISITTAFSISMSSAVISPHQASSPPASTWKAISGGRCCALTRTCRVPPSVFHRNGNERPLPTASVRKLTHASAEWTARQTICWCIHSTETNATITSPIVAAAPFPIFPLSPGSITPRMAVGSLFSIMIGTDGRTSPWSTRIQPLFNLYHNEMAAAGLRGGMIAIRFVGGNHSAAPSKGFTCRDGFGARVLADLGDEKLVREHRCGDGWATQNSATMIIGIGAHPSVASLSVRWPSGKSISTEAVPAGTLLVAYENPSDAPNGVAFVRAPYEVKPRLANASPEEGRGIPGPVPTP
jgi:hypothetical protein